MKNIIDYSKYCIKPGEDVSLKKFDTKYSGDKIDKAEGVELLIKTREHLSELQDKLYAHNEYSVLIVLQAMDAAGKDGAINHIMSGLSPSGVKVTSFKVPSSNELEHDYFWRHYKALPARGEIGIFNRSHYENVLVTKVHPEYILNENLPNIDKLSDIDQKFWDNRYKQIKRFEKNLYQNGTIIFKFFLHLSYEEQKERFLDRINDPKKNWKFSPADARERQYWDKYQSAYEEALTKTSTNYAPWFVIPADNKWYSRLAIAEILYNEFGKLNLHYPEVSEKTKEELQKIKAELEKE